jgi:hypothetical protein
MEIQHVDFLTAHVGLLSTPAPVGDVPHWAPARRNGRDGPYTPLWLYLIARGELFAFCHDYLHLRHFMSLPSNKHAYLFSMLSRWQLDCWPADEVCAGSAAQQGKGRQPVIRAVRSLEGPTPQRSHSSTARSSPTTQRVEKGRRLSYTSHLEISRRSVIFCFPPLGFGPAETFY